MVSIPPNASARLELFLSSVADYRELEETHPTKKAIQVGASADPASYWLYVLHAAVLRKYFAGGDYLNLVRVIEAMTARIVDEKPNMREHLDELRRGCSEFSTRSTVKFVDQSGTERDEADVTFDDLYGRHLHGDWDRWTRTVVLPKQIAEGALMFWTTRAVTLLNGVEQSLQLGLREGSISIEPR